jgi:hypothetical protein
MRAGVFLCECGGNISGVVEMEPLAAHARTLDGVVEVAVNQFMCGTEGRDLIAQAVEERGLDHVVIASCSQRFQGPTFDRIARELRLGENAVAFANIREGCSFVHRHEPERAQEKAKKIVEGAAPASAPAPCTPRRRATSPSSRRSASTRPSPSPTSRTPSRRLRPRLHGALRDDCTRGEVDEPIAIRSLKRFVSDWAADNVPLPDAIPPVYDEKVAVVGAGPAGLTCARDLALMGYAVTVFESKAEPGGMLRHGIPEYRLPKDALQRDIDRILALGVDLQCGKTAGVDFTVDGLLEGRGLQGRLPRDRPAGRPHAAAPRRRRQGRPRRRQPALQGDRRRAGRDGQARRRHRRRRRRLRRRPHRPASRRRDRHHQLHRGRRDRAGLDSKRSRRARRERRLQLLLHARRRQGRRRGQAPAA